MLNLWLCKNWGLPSPLLLRSSSVLVVAFAASGPSYAQTIFNGSVATGVNQFQSYAAPAEGAVINTKPGSVSQPTGLPIHLDVGLGIDSGLKGLRLRSQVNYLHAAAMTHSPASGKGLFRTFDAGVGLVYRWSARWQPRLGIDIGWHQTAIEMAGITHTVTAFVPQFEVSIEPIQKLRFSSYFGVGMSPEIAVRSGSQQGSLGSSSAQLWRGGAEAIIRLRPTADIVFGFEMQQISMSIADTSNYQAFGLRSITPVRTSQEVELISQGLTIGARRRW